MPCRRQQRRIVSANRETKLRGVIFGDRAGSVGRMTSQADQHAVAVEAIPSGAAIHMTVRDG
jgi:hypothetical protein